MIILTIAVICRFSSYMYLFIYLLITTIYVVIF